jgi:hypothetical protein
LSHYYFSCGIIGHSSIECKEQGERDEEGKLPYSADRLCTPDDRKKKTQGAWLSSEAMSANQGHGRSSSQQASEKPSQSSSKEDVGEETS